MLFIYLQNVIFSTCFRRSNLISYLIYASFCQVFSSRRFAITISYAFLIFSKENLGFRTLKMMSLCNLESLEPVYPVTERQIVKEEYYQSHSYENLNTRTNFRVKCLILTCITDFRLIWIKVLNFSI